MFIAVDFDGTIVTHEYPRVGDDIGAVPYLLQLQERHQLILWTMRDGETLDAAVAMCEDRGIKFWGINKNPNQSWSNSPKAYAHLYIDDAAYGIPLTTHAPGIVRPYVDWSIVGPDLIKALL